MHVFVLFVITRICETGFAFGLGISTAEQSVVSMDKVNLTWRTLSNQSSSTRVIRMTLSIDMLEGTDDMWVGIGFGYDNFHMNGHKSALIAVVQAPANCSVKYGYLESTHSLVLVHEVDPWDIQPLCFLDTEPYRTAQLTFIVGGSSKIQIPDGPMYLLLAYGKGADISNHGTNWDYKKVNLLSADPTVAPPIDPWLLTHGIVYIIVFSIMMPLTSFLILFNRDKYFVLHKVLGVIITSLLVLGWAVLSVSAEERADGAVYAPMNSTAVALTHSPTGIAGKYVALLVCILGILVAALRMPKKIHLWVRIAHGVAGGIVSFLGPLVVWNGWVRLAPNNWTPLISTPLIWMGILMILVLLLSISYLFRLGKRPKEEDLEMQECLPVFDFANVKNLMINNDNLVFVYNGFVVQPNSNWVHPGGDSVLTEHNGQDIGQVFDSIHSPGALKQLESMRIGRIVPDDAPFVSKSIVAIDNVLFVYGTVRTMTRVTKNRETPVMHFVIQTDQILSIGTKVRLSRNNVERTYTVARVAGNTFSLFIKIYPEGRLTRTLALVTPGEKFNFKLSRAMSLPIPDNKPIVLLAGGTGIVPMLQYVMHPRIVLLWWLRDAEDWFDIGIRNAKIYYTQNDGRISRAQIDQHDVELSECVVIMSGPSGFIRAAQTVVAGAGQVFSLD